MQSIYNELVQLKAFHDLFVTEIIPDIENPTCSVKTATIAEGGQGAPQGSPIIDDANGTPSGTAFVPANTLGSLDENPEPEIDPNLSNDSLESTGDGTGDGSRKSKYKSDR